MKESKVIIAEVKSKEIASIIEAWERDEWELVTITGISYGLASPSIALHFTRKKAKS